MTAVRVIASAAALVALAAPAQAATVSATSTPSGGPFGVASGSVRFEAAPGEANRMSARLVDGSRGVVEVRETRAPLTVGAGCTLLQDGVARCDTAGDFVDVTVEAGDLDDEVTINDPLYGLIFGGAGDDTLTGGCQLTGAEGNDVLVGCGNTSPGLGHSVRGGPGDDRVSGGPGGETIDGGGGHDVLGGGDGDDSITDADGAAGEPGGDVVDGGGGADTLSYAARTASVQVDLAQPDALQGASGENDLVRGVENVLGGTGNDRLLGDAQANRLDGGQGNDLVDGRGGPDQLLAGAGVDVVTGGAGADYVVARDVYRDSIDCGPDGDTLLSDRGDAIRGCEGVTSAYRLTSFSRVGALNRRVSLRVRCLESDELPRLVAREFEPCRLDVALRMRINGRVQTVGSSTCTLQGCRTLVMTRTAWRVLLARRSTTAWVQFTRVPRTGSLRHLDRVTLKVHRAARVA